MIVRRAAKADMDSLYLMGFDTWHGGKTADAYLADCRGDSKYAAGEWFVLVDDERPLASLVVYSEMFGLAEGCFGLGSIATDPPTRGKGYGSYLTKSVTDLLLKERGAKAVYLHSDIDTGFYANLGYTCLAKGDSCMVQTLSGEIPAGDKPTYF